MAQGGLMAVVTFYEKPGCKGNLRQKTLLAAAGHTVQAKSLKTEAWTADRLLAFLGKLPVSTWFNQAAPAVKSGEIVPENVSFEHALQLLLENPLLIRRLETVAKYEEITTIVLNHLEPDHSGALPELLKRAPQAKVYLSSRAQMMLKALLKPTGEKPPEYIPVTTDDTVDLGGRTLRFLHTPYLHWPDTQCTYLEEDGLLFTGDIFGCHFCDNRLFNDTVGDFRFSFEYYYAHIMRPFREYVLDAVALIETLDIKLIAPAHGPILRHKPRDYVNRYRELATPRLFNEARSEKTLVVFYLSAYGNTRRMAKALAAGAESIGGVRVSLYDLEGGEADIFTDLVEEADGLAFGSPTINADAVKPIWDLLSSLTTVNIKGKLGEFPVGGIHVRHPQPMTGFVPGHQTAPCTSRLALLVVFSASSTVSSGYLYLCPLKALKTVTTLSAELCPLKSLFSKATKSISSFQARPSTHDTKATVAPLMIETKDLGILTVKRTATEPGFRSTPNFSMKDGKCCNSSSEPEINFNSSPFASTVACLNSPTGGLRRPWASATSPSCTTSSPR